MSNNFRSKEVSDQYAIVRAEPDFGIKCALCDKESIKEFEYWRVMKNDFPYDLIAKTHNMLVTKRHTSGADLNNFEANELNEIKEVYIHTEYDYMIEATYRKKSIPGHHHIHLIEAR